jgi:uncharacterized protein YjiS (DUF1127 family)
MMVAHTSQAFPVTFEQPARRSPLAGIVRVIREWYRRQLAMAELERLSERELQDIGIARNDFHAIVSGAYRR